MDFRFSSYGRASQQAAPVNKMMADFATDFRDDVDINLGVGYVNERTIPTDLIGEALAAVSAPGSIYRQALNYGGPQGSANLIGALRKFYCAHAIGGIAPAVLAEKDFLIGPSGATSLLDAIADVLAPGIVITSDPMYYIYCNALERKGFRVIAVPEDEAGIDLVLLQRKLSELGEAVEEIAFFYLVTVNNPSCTILSNARRKELLNLVTDLSERQGRRIPLFLDQAYELLIHDENLAPPLSPLKADRLGLVYELGTLSKVIAPALRIGYLLGSPGPFFSAMVQKTSDVGFSAPLMTQEIAAYLLEHHIDDQLRFVKQGYREKAVAVRAFLEEHLGEHVELCRGGQAGFYYYITLRNTETHSASPLFRFLSRRTGKAAVDGPQGNPHPRVIYIPGEYCVHPEGDCVARGRREFRLSYGFESLENLERAIVFIREGIAFAG